MSRAALAAYYRAHNMPEEADALSRPKARRKYGNTPTEHAGVVYASKLEAGVAAQLDLLIRTGFVIRYERQVRYEIGPGIWYDADFCVWYADGSAGVLDAKGVLTPVFKLKKKLFEALHGPLILVMEPGAVPLTGGPTNAT